MRCLPPSNRGTRRSDHRSDRDETTIAQTYGFAPAYAIPAAAPITYEAIAKHPDIVTGVTPIGEILRARGSPSFLIEEDA